MVLIQARDQPPESIAKRRSLEDVEVTTAEVAAGVTREGVQSEQGRADDQNNGPQADAESETRRGREEECDDRVPPEEDQDDNGEIEKVAVEVLEHPGKARLALIGRPRVANHAGRRRPEKRAVVGLAI